MKPENHKLAVICRSVGVNPCEIYEVFRRIRRAVMDEGGEVITHELGTFFRSERKATRKVLHGVEYLVPARTCLALAGVKGPGVDQMEAQDVCSTNPFPTGSFAPGVVLFNGTRQGQLNVMEGSKFSIRHAVNDPPDPADIETDSRDINSSWATRLSTAGHGFVEAVGIEFSNVTERGVVSEYSFTDAEPIPGDLFGIDVDFIRRQEGTTWLANTSIILNGQALSAREVLIDRCNVVMDVETQNDILSSGGGQRSASAVPSVLLVSTTLN